MTTTLIKVDRISVGWTTADIVGYSSAIRDAAQGEPVAKVSALEMLISESIGDS